MKLTVLIPSEEYKGYAGARIRYGRLAPKLERGGIHLSLQDIANINLSDLSGDALLISKCHDARSLVAATAASRRGLMVGVDLFDDYFSQRGDSRLVRFRSWLRQLLPICDFALFSTEAMVRVAQDYRSDLPVLVVNDPAPESQSDNLPETLNRKLAAARSERRLRLAWFGVGDNPYFRVGISDLAAWSEMLRVIAQGDFAVDLTVLTNERALDAERLALLAALPVQTSIEEWSEIRERDLLEQAFACFLPVNLQGFSAAKSLNRAVTALTAGCQVISAGFPLYAPLGDFVYRDATSFLRDVSRGSMKYSESRFEAFRRKIAEVASPDLEAENIAEFLKELKPHPRAQDRQLVLVQGQAPNGLAHKAVKALGGLSVASPYCAHALGFDVVFRGSFKGLDMLVSDTLVARLPTDLSKGLVATTIGERKFWLITHADETGRSGNNAPIDWHSSPLPFQLATYAHSMAVIRTRMEEAFGLCQVLVSESSQLPFTAEF